MARLRELVALEELSRISAGLRALDGEIAALRDRRFDIANPCDGAIEDRWRAWQITELSRLNARKAGIAADHRVATEKLGRMRAECEVIDRLAEKARWRESRRRSERASYIS